MKGALKIISPIKMIKGGGQKGFGNDVNRIILSFRGCLQLNTMLTNNKYWYLLTDLVCHGQGRRKLIIANVNYRIEQFLFILIEFRSLMAR